VDRITQVFLGTGELLFATSPCEVKTILGSCVGVALYDQRNRWGGLCHYLLAQDPDLDSADTAGSSTRFGQVAIPALAQKLVRAGSNRRDLVAVVAGGALLLDANEVFFVGEKNVRLANQLLDHLGIPIVHRDIGGDRGRKMVFRTYDGTFAIERIAGPDPDTLTI
jgi:chemotaxis protein CheD